MQYDNAKHQPLSPLNTADRYNKNNNKTTLRSDHNKGITRVINDTTSATEHDELSSTSPGMNKIYFHKNN